MGQSYVMCFLFGHLLFNLRLVLFVGPFWKWKALYIPDSGRGKKNKIIVTRIITLHPPPSFEGLRFFAEAGTRIESCLVTVQKRKKKNLVLSCQSCWHMKDWTLFKKKRERNEKRMKQCELFSGVYLV